MVLEISLTKNYSTECMERKKNIYWEEQTVEGRFSIPQYDLSLSTCIHNINFLCYTVVEISLTKNMERKKKEQIQGRINRRRPVLNPTIQSVIVNLCTKYEETCIPNIKFLS